MQTGKMIKQLFQLTLFLSCTLLVCVPGQSVVDKVERWDIEQAFERQVDDSDNNDIDIALNTSILIQPLFFPEERNLFVNNNQRQKTIIFGFIRAPPSIPA